MREAKGELKGRVAGLRNKITKTSYYSGEIRGLHSNTVATTLV